MEASRKKLSGIFLVERKYFTKSRYFRTTNNSHLGGKFT